MGRGAQSTVTDRFSAIFGNRRGLGHDEPVPTVKLTREFQELLGDWEGIDTGGSSLIFLFPRAFEDEVELGQACAILEEKFPGLTLTKSRPRQDAIFVSGDLIKASGLGRSGLHALARRLGSDLGFEGTVEPMGPALLRD